LFQLAAGGFIDNFFSTINGLLGGAQNQADSTQQQFQDFFQSFSDSLSSQIDSGLSQFNSSQNDTCRNNQTQQLYALGNQTRE
jgi:hypothetical protein